MLIVTLTAVYIIVQLTGRYHQSFAHHIKIAVGSVGELLDLAGNL